MKRVGLLLPTDLPTVDTIDDLISALAPGVCDDVVFVHSRSYTLPVTPEGLRRGVNVFGPGRALALEGSHVSIVPTRQISSVVLNGACYFPNSLSIVDRSMRLFLSGIENIGDPKRLADYDPFYFLGESGELMIREKFFSDAVDMDIIAVPACAAGFPNYGHFLYDGLPAAFMLSCILPGERFRIVGQPLHSWQEQILSALGLRDSYVEIKAPVRFRKMLASTMLALHVSYPTGFVRPIFDFLRYRYGTRNTANKKLFISRGGSKKRWLLNRAEVEACATEFGFEIVRPEQLSFAEQVRLFSNATVVIGESGAGMANVGFCQPGAAVLEIQPERFFEGWTRAMCFLFGHRWHIYQAVDVPDFRSLYSDVDGTAETLLAYHVDIPEFRQAVSVLLDHAMIRSE